MFGTSGIRSYQETTIRTMGPERLITLLYEGIFQDLGRAEQDIGDGNIAGRARAVNRALAIVAELKHSLDHPTAPELCNRLAALYDYVSGELLQVHLDGEVRHLERTRRVLTPLYEAWRAIPDGTAQEARSRRGAGGPDPARALDGQEDSPPAPERPGSQRELCVAV